MVGTAQPLCLLRQEPKASLREHHESAEKEPQSLVPLRGLDDQTIFPGSYRREEVFVLTSLFIERDSRNRADYGRVSVGLA